MYPYQCTCPEQIPFYLAYYLHVPPTGSAAYQSSINQDGKVPKTPGPPSLPPVGAMHTFSTYMYLRSGSAQGNGNVKYLCFFWGIGRKGYHLLYLASSTT